METGFRGAIFDVDGVLVDSPHEPAWRRSFQELMEGQWSDIRDQTSYSPDKFTSQVYQEVMSGKPRMEGARALIDYFGVPDPERRTEEYADRKQRMVVELIEAGEFEAYPDAFVTEGLSLLDFFDADISGRDFARGKPHPEIFLTGAEELGVPPESCFVVEDAVSGVQAAKAGNMAALGIARHEDEDLLAGGGADLVVTSLDDVDVDGLSEGRLTRKEPARKDG
jgi:beta-phosphoglucomutase